MMRQFCLHKMFLLSPAKNILLSNFINGFKKNIKGGETATHENSDSDSITIIKLNL